jgi:hypothetical protein
VPIPSTVAQPDHARPCAAPAQTRRAHTLPMQHKHQNGAGEQVRLDDSRRRAVAIADQLGDLPGRDVTADCLAVPGQRRHLPQRRAVQQHPKDLSSRSRTPPGRSSGDHNDRTTNHRGATAGGPLTGRQVLPCSWQNDSSTDSHSRPKATSRDHQQRRRGRPGGGLETGWAAAETHSEQMNPRCKRRISGYPRRYVAPDPGGAVGRQRWRVTLRGTDGRSSRHRPTLVA